MSTEWKWCFLNWSKCEIDFFALGTTHWFMVYVPSNQIHLFLGTFAKKMGQKDQKIDLKLLGLVWYGLIWLGYDPGSWLNPKTVFKLSKTAMWKVWFMGVLEKLWNSLLEAVGFFWFFKDQFGSQLCQTKPYQTKPKHLGQFSGLFCPFLGQKYLKVNGFDLRTHIPWTSGLSPVQKSLSHLLTNSKNIISIRRTCVRVNSDEKAL